MVRNEELKKPIPTTGRDEKKRILESNEEPMDLQTLNP